VATLTLTLTGPDAVVNGLVPVFAAAHGWTPALGTTPAQHARDVFARFLRESVTAELVRQAQQAATAAAAQQATQSADQLTLTLA
jgi:hypothetical protein